MITSSSVRQKEFVCIGCEARQSRRRNVSSSRSTASGEVLSESTNHVSAKLGSDGKLTALTDNISLTEPDNRFSLRPVSKEGDPSSGLKNEQPLITTTTLKDRNEQQIKTQSAFKRWHLPKLPNLDTSCTSVHKNDDLPLTAQFVRLGTDEADSRYTISQNHSTAQNFCDTNQIESPQLPAQLPRDEHELRSEATAQSRTIPKYLDGWGAKVHDDQKNQGPEISNRTASQEEGSHVLTQERIRDTARKFQQDFSHEQSYSVPMTSLQTPASSTASPTTRLVESLFPDRGQATNGSLSTYSIVDRCKGNHGGKPSDERPLGSGSNADKSRCEKHGLVHICQDSVSTDVAVPPSPSSVSSIFSLYPQKSHGQDSRSNDFAKLSKPLLQKCCRCGKQILQITLKNQLLCATCKRTEQSRIQDNSPFVAETPDITDRPRASDATPDLEINQTPNSASPRPSLKRAGPKVNDPLFHKSKKPKFRAGSAPLNHYRLDTNSNTSNLIQTLSHTPAPSDSVNDSRTQETNVQKMRDLSSNPLPIASFHSQDLETKALKATLTSLEQRVKDVESSKKRLSEELSVQKETSSRMEKEHKRSMASLKSSKNDLLKQLETARASFSEQLAERDQVITSLRQLETSVKEKTHSLEDKSKLLEDEIRELREQKKDIELNVKLKLVEAEQMEDKIEQLRNELETTNRDWEEKCKHQEEELMNLRLAQDDRPAGRQRLHEVLIDKRDSRSPAARSTASSAEGESAIAELKACGVTFEDDPESDTDDAFKVTALKVQPVRRFRPFSCLTQGCNNTTESESDHYVPSKPDDREAKRKEIAARPTRKQTFGKTLPRWHKGIENEICNHRFQIVNEPKLVLASSRYRRGATDERGRDIAMDSTKEIEHEATEILGTWSDFIGLPRNLSTVLTQEKDLGYRDGAEMSKAGRRSRAKEIFRVRAKNDARVG